MNTRSKRDFLSLLDCTADELNWLVNRAIEMKRLHRAGELEQTAARQEPRHDLPDEQHAHARGVRGRHGQLGGHAIVLNPADSQLGRGEPIEDTARVMSEMVDAVVIRTRSRTRTSCASRLPRPCR
jgi:ornithine carbamoyltransferase